MAHLSPSSPAAEFHPLTVPALCQDTRIHLFPNLSPRARLQKTDHPCLWVEPGSLGCLFALHSNTKAKTASESPGAWPGGHNHSRARGCVSSWSSRNYPWGTPTHWTLGLLCAGLFHTYLCSSVPGASLETLCPIHTRWPTLALVHRGEKQQSGVAC